MVKPEPEVEYSLVLDGRRLVSTEPLKRLGLHLRRIEWKSYHMLLSLLRGSKVSKKGAA